MKTTLQYAKIQLLRNFRDPITLAVLFGIPILLLVIFGVFVGGDNQNVSLNVAVVNESKTEYAKQFEQQLKKVDVLKQSDEKLSRQQAENNMKESKLDGVIVLPSNFGEVDNGRPVGKITVIADQSDISSGDILMGIVGSVAEGANHAILGSSPPIQVERSSIEGTSTRVFDNLYAMFTGMAIMMVGIFAVASAIPADKKSGVLRRMRVTPFKSSQLIIGMVLAFIVVSVTVVIAMTVLAVTAFNMDMRGSWIDLSIFVLVASMLMIALGVMVGGWAKNSTQADIYGQIIFISSLAFSGLWVPRALMPGWLQDISAFLPLTPVIEGLQRIVTEGVGLTSLGFQFAVLAGWFIIALIIGTKTFRWE